MQQVACCQFDIAWEDKPANYAKVEALLAGARLAAGTLVLLPEMFATGFSMNLDAAEGSGGPTETFLAKTARRFGVYLLAGLARRGPSGKGCNEAAGYGPTGSEFCRYRKLYPFPLGGEDRAFAPGERTTLGAWGNVRVAPFICYDLRFPEVFRLAAVNGAHLLAVLANWPAPREAHWVTLLRARAIENQAYVAAVNRCGRDPKLAYSGRSLLIDPWGEVLADAGDGERIIRADVSPEAVDSYRKEFPALASIRGEFLPAPGGPHPGAARRD